MKAEITKKPDGSFEAHLFTDGYDITEIHLIDRAKRDSLEEIENWCRKGSRKPTFRYINFTP